MDARLAWIWLSRACGAGSRAPLNLLHHFGSPEKILRADRRELSEVLGSSNLHLLTALANKDTSEAVEILHRCEDAGILILTPQDALYPRTLYQLRDAPCVL